jgi:hypothetical protein
MIKSFPCFYFSHTIYFFSHYWLIVYPQVLRFSGKYLPNGMILALMETLPNACSIIDRFLGRQVILSKHSLDMRFTQIDKS